MASIRTEMGTDPPDIGFMSRLKITDLFTVARKPIRTHYVIPHRGRQSQSLQVRPTRSQAFETPSPFRSSHASVDPTRPHPESCRIPPSQDPRDASLYPSNPRNPPHLESPLGRLQVHWWLRVMPGHIRGYLGRLRHTKRATESTVDAFKEATTSVQLVDCGCEYEKDARTSW